MFKKLIAGELSLGATFWKFGVLGLLTINIVTKIFGVMLARKLQGYNILEFYVTAFKKLTLEASTGILTVLYLSSMGFLIFYSISMILGVWRSSAQYNQSLWLRHLSRILIIILAIATLRASF